MKTKILFWIDLFTLHFGTASYLQKLIDCDLFALIDVTDRPKKFFQKQKFVKFEKTWYFHDHITKNYPPPNISYLKQFEQKFGINLWQLAVNERIFYFFNPSYKFSENEILSILEQECKLFETIINEAKPEFVIIEQPSLHHSYLFFLMCKSKGIKTLMINPSFLGYKCFISQEPNKIDSIEKLENFKSTGRTFNELQSYRKNLNFSNVIQDYTKNLASSKILKLKAAIDFLIFSTNTNLKSHYTYYGRNKLHVLTKSIKLSLKRKYRKLFLDNNTISHVDNNEHFVYFPLQVEPDRNLLIGAPYFTNQLECIRHITKSLPIGFKLYVKEHPAQNQSWRSTSYYKQIMDVPNVKLIHPSVPSEILYKNCSLVLTIGGTSGFEAAFYGKPTIVLADVGYSQLSSITRIKELEKLPDAIKQSLQQKVISHDLDRFLIYLEKNSFDFDLFGYYTMQANYFFYGSNLIDVEISIAKMQNFLNENKKTFEKLALEFIKKIQL